MRNFTDSGSQGQYHGNPFVEDIFVDHPDQLPGVAQIHHRTFSHIVDSVESIIVESRQEHRCDSLGRTILVTAPRAGYGKSHLAARLRQHLRSAATTLTLPLDPSRPVSWPVAFSSILRQFYNETGSHSGSSTQFEESGRYLLAQIVLTHIAGGSLNLKDCPADEAHLRSEFVEIFSSESSPKMLSWIDKRARELCREVSREFLGRLGLSRTELGFWTRLIIDFNLRGDTALEPLRGLSNGEARERMLQWLRIATFYRPVLIVADGLDGFFRSETAGMEIAGLLTGIRESVARSITVISVNEDVWESVFKDRLPSAWIDRITGEREKLRPIAPESARELVQSRLEPTGMPTSGIHRFVDQLETDHLWVDSETKLSPRSVIRQARELWNSGSESYFNVEPYEDALSEEIAEKPLSELTDKVEFFSALQEDRLGPVTSGPLSPKSKPESESARLEPGAPTSIPAAPANPFFAPPATSSTEDTTPDHLAGIDSIIADIRGTGKTVVSETSISPPTTTPRPESTPGDASPGDASPGDASPGDASPEDASPEDASPGAIPQSVDQPVASSFQAGSLHVKPTDSGSETKAPRSPDTAPVSPVTAPIPLVNPATSPKPADIESMLREREEQLKQGPALQLDLERVEQFVRSVGRQHPGLEQQEERFPSSRSVCLRWTVRGQSILIGFESPKNVYFWNNLLQQSLASPDEEKIAAFSHDSDPFDPRLFSSFGFSPAVTANRIDVIKMNDRELAMIYAAEEVYSQFLDTPHSEKATQIITRHLDPLWRRISRPTSAQ